MTVALLLKCFSGLTPRRPSIQIPLNADSSCENFHSLLFWPYNQCTCRLSLAACPITNGVHSCSSSTCYAPSSYQGISLCHIFFCAVKPISSVFPILNLPFAFFVKGGSLDKYKHVPEQILGPISVSVVRGLQYLWSLKIMHRGTSDNWDLLHILCLRVFGKILVQNALNLDFWVEFMSSLISFVRVVLSQC